MRNEIKKIIESNTAKTASIIIELLIDKKIIEAKLDGAIEQVKKDIESIKNYEA